MEDTVCDLKSSILPSSLILLNNVIGEENCPSKEIANFENNSLPLRPEVAENTRESEKKLSETEENSVSINGNDNDSAAMESKIMGNNISHDANFNSNSQQETKGNAEEKNKMGDQVVASELKISTRIAVMKKRMKKKKILHKKKKKIYMKLGL